jgi:uncharacterized protein with HEPN domain
MRRDDETRLRHMLDHAAEAVELVSGRTRSDLDTDRVLGLALVRLLEIVGEAAARTSVELREAQSEVPWGQIVGLRNRLIHGYDSVDMDILWQVLRDDLPPLIVAVSAILPESSQFLASPAGRAAGGQRTGVRPVRWPSR